MKNKKQELIELRNKRKQEARESRKKLKLEVIEIKKKTKILQQEESRVRNEINAQNQKDRALHKQETIENKKILKEKIAALNDKKSIIRKQKLKLKEQSNLEKTKIRKQLLEFKNFKKDKLMNLKSEKQDFLQNKNLEKKALVSQLAEKKIKLEKELLAKKTKTETKRLEKIKEIEKQKSELAKSKIKLLGIKNEQLKERRLKRAKKLEKFKLEKEELRIAKIKLKDKSQAIKYKDSTAINEAAYKANEEIKLAKEAKENLKDKLLDQKHEEEIIQITNQIKNMDNSFTEPIQEQENTKFEEEFKIAFDEKDNVNNDERDNNEVVKAIIINSYGKSGAKIYKYAQNQSNDKILNKLKKDLHIVEIINKYREKIKIEKPVQFNKLIPFAEENKTFEKEFINQFFSHAATTILMGKSLKFGNGYICKYKIKNIPIYKYSSSPINEQVVDYIDPKLGKKLNKLVIKKLKNKAAIEITKGLLLDASSGEPELLFDTNVMI